MAHTDEEWNNIEKEIKAVGEMVDKESHTGVDISHIQRMLEHDIKHRYNLSNYQFTQYCILITQYDKKEGKKNGYNKQKTNI